MSTDVEQIGTLEYRNEPLGHEGGVCVRVASEGILIGAYSREDGDTNLFVPVDDCERLIALLNNAVKRFRLRSGK